MPRDVKAQRGVGGLVAIGEGLVELGPSRGRAGVRLGFGGDAANVCVMAAHVGVRSQLAGRVGDDGFGNCLLTFWRDHGVDVSFVRRDPHAPTGLYVNEATDSGHRFTYWRRGSAGSRLLSADLHDSLFEDLAVLVVTGVTLAVSRSSGDAAAYACDRAAAAGARIACVVNYRPALGGNLEELADLARRSDIVIASREDAEAVFGTHDPAALFAAIGSRPAELLMTDGSGPASVTGAEGTILQPPPRVPVRDAAGAGDALAGAYLAARLRGDSPADSLALGVAAASLSVRDYGCAASYPRAEEIAALLPALAAQADTPTGPRL